MFPRAGLIRASLLALFLVLPAFSRAQQADEVKGAPAEPADAAEVRSEIALTERLQSSVPDRGAVLYFIATRKQHLGETYEAMKLMKECVALREGFDPSGSPSFFGLREAKEFQDLAEAVHRDFPVVAQAHVVFETAEKDIVPEGLAFNARQNVFYLSSLNLRKILKITPKGESGEVSDFVPAGVHRLLPVLGIRMDPTDDSVKHGFNDLVVRKNGEVILTDSLSGAVYRFDPRSHSFTSLRLDRELSYPNGIALASDDRQLFIADDLGVIRLDLQSNTSAEVNPGAHSTLAGIDGLYWHHGGLIAVQNDIGSPRIAAFRLSNDGLHVTRTTVLENRTPLVATPTTGAIKDNDFYFIVNSQIDNLNDDKVLDATRLTRVRIAAVHLPW